MAKHILLYHGSDQQVTTPRWDAGENGHDFGKCFYTTYNRETALDWAKKRFSYNPIVNQYAINLEKLENGTLKIKHFHADEEWARFVWNNHNNPFFRRPAYDIIIGPIADKGLKEKFILKRTQNLTFEEIVPLIHFDKFKSLQVAFCSEYAISMFNPQC